MVHNCPVPNTDFDNLALQRWADDGGFDPYDLVNESKLNRLMIFKKQLEDAEPASTYDEARRLVNNTLISVENRTGIPNNISTWETDGRMYPVLNDNIRPHPDNPNVMVLRSKRQLTYISSNGAIA